MDEAAVNQRLSSIATLSQIAALPTARRIQHKYLQAIPSNDSLLEPRTPTSPVGLTRLLSEREDLSEDEQQVQAWTDVKEDGVDVSDIQLNEACCEPVEASTPRQPLEVTSAQDTQALGLEAQDSTVVVPVSRSSSPSGVEHATKVPTTHLVHIPPLLPAAVSSKDETVIATAPSVVQLPLPAVPKTSSTFAPAAPAVPAPASNPTQSQYDILGSVLARRSAVPLSPPGTPTAESRRPLLDSMFAHTSSPLVSLHSPATSPVTSNASARSPLFALLSERNLNVPSDETAPPVAPPSALHVPAPVPNIGSSIQDLIESIRRRRSAVDR
eukprot:TRINITY_DN6679_c0_g2_i1.p1 TRINITY_DN6679_c0_g2~~TRINITY_DN6679_c0_g2_i1.p1  ORF type:complete len:350 (-),score=63.80 TRINITY_DN6679_c0_g2_i1:260-1240(-)